MSSDVIARGWIVDKITLRGREVFMASNEAKKLHLLSETMTELEEMVAFAELGLDAMFDHYIEATCQCGQCGKEKRDANLS